MAADEDAVIAFRSPDMGYDQITYTAPQRKSREHLIKSFDSNPWKRGLSSKDIRGGHSQRGAPRPGTLIPAAAGRPVYREGLRGGQPAVSQQPQRPQPPGAGSRFEYIPRQDYTRPASRLPYSMERQSHKQNYSSMAVTPEDRKRDLILNQSNITRIADAISRKMGRTLGMGEISEIATVMRGMDYKKLADMTVSDINNKIASIIYRNLKGYECRDDDDDNRLRWRLAAKSLLEFEQSQAQINNIQNISNVNQSCCDEFYMSSPIVFDSRFASVGGFPVSIFSFTVTTDTGGGGSGKVSSFTEITNVRKMRITQFDIPYVNSIDNSDTDRVSLIIDNLKAQSHLSPNGFSFHFLFDKEVIGNRIRLTPAAGFDTFTFGSAISTFSDIDFRFLDGIRAIQFPRFGESSAIFTLIAGPPVILQIQTANPHGMSTGDTVFIENYQTIADVTTPEENILQDIRGHKITKVSNDTFTINVDMTGNSLTPFDGYALYYGNQRWRLPMVVTFIRPITFIDSIITDP